MFRSAKQQLCSCITLFCQERMIHVFVEFFAVVARLQRRSLLVSRFTEDANTRQQFSFSFSETENSPFELKFPKKFLNIWQIEWNGIRLMKIEKAWIHFWSEVFAALAVVVALRWCWGTKKRATKNVQLVLQHCWKTSWIAMLRVLPATFKPVWQQIRLLTGLNVGGKTHNTTTQLVLQQYCKTSCAFFAARFSVPLACMF